jgi:hypothetical protein
MATTLKQRVERLEKQVEELCQAATTAGPKDWRRTFGASAGNDGFDEMIRLGQAVRRGEKPAGHGRARS